MVFLIQVLYIPEVSSYIAIVSRAASDYPLGNNPCYILEQFELAAIQAGEKLEDKSISSDPIRHRKRHSLYCRQLENRKEKPSYILRYLK